jgi:hypothetical protein
MPAGKLTPDGKRLLAEVVRDEVEENLLLHAERLSSVDADQLIEDYRRLIKLTNPERIPCRINIG